MQHEYGSFSWHRIALQEDNLTEALPELNALRQVVERTDWHDDDVLQQSIRLFRWVKRLPNSLRETLDAPETTLRALLCSTVDSNPGRYTIQELLAFVALIHDLGKAATFQRLPDGTTRCPGHEAVSARMAPTICARFDFTPAETRFIINVVRTHGTPYALFKEIASLPVLRKQERMRRFEDQAGDHLPLLVLACGDLVTSHLRINCPEKYEAVLGFYRSWLQSIWGREA